MLLFKKFSLLLTAIATSSGLWASFAHAEGLCFILYQMADTDLERDIRADNTELIQSSFLQDDPTVTAWIYYDGLNPDTPGYEQHFTEGPLPELYQPDGTPVTEKFMGSRYLTYNYTTQQMIVDTELEGEQNSDSIPVLYDFVTYALEDCVAQGKDEYFIAFSAHGAAFHGFGGDANTGERSRRLAQSNQDINQALVTALADTEGAPAMFDVLGFDACLMSSYTALDDYLGTAKYYLASEAVEPGHGWAYNTWTPNSAVDLAVQAVSTFVSETQKDCTEELKSDLSAEGYEDAAIEDYCNSHDTPKTLAVIDMSNYTTFVGAWEALAEELNSLLTANDDSLFHSQLARAHASAVAFSGYFEDPNLKTKSEIDMGSFLAAFQALCDINPESTLYAHVQNTTSAYENLFVAFEIGVGTPEATGMAVFWPSKQFYQSDRTSLDTTAFNETHHYYTSISPNWNAFLETYYATAVPEAVPILDTCMLCAEVDPVVQQGDELLVNPMIDSSQAVIIVNASIVPQVSFVEVEYGLDLTALLPSTSDEGARSLKESLGSHLASATSHHARKLSTSKKRRRIQENEDYLIVFGGSVSPNYGCSNFMAAWDGHFYQLLSTQDGTTEWLFASARGGTMYSAPVIYFDTVPDEDTLAKFNNKSLTYDDAVSAGGADGEFTFSSVACEGSTNLALYTYTPSGLAEKPPSAGGFVIPLVFVEGTINGNSVDVLLGGFNSSAFSWVPNHGLIVQSVPTTGLLEQIQVDTAIVDLFAISLDGEEETTDLHTFDLVAADLEPIAGLCESLLDESTAVERSGGDEEKEMTEVTSIAWKPTLVGAGSLFLAVVVSLFW